MSYETDESQTPVQALIEDLRTSEHILAPLLMQSLFELYDSGEFASYFVDPISNDEYSTRTSTLGWRFIIACINGWLLAPVLTLTDQQQNEHLTDLMIATTLDLKEPVEEAKPFVDQSLPTAINAAQGIGLQTLAVMQISEHNITHRHIIEIAYPHIYREIGQIDVVAQIEGMNIDPIAKNELGLALAVQLLKQTPFGDSAIFEQL